MNIIKTDEEMKQDTEMSITQSQFDVTKLELRVDLSAIETIIGHANRDLDSFPLMKVRSFMKLAEDRLKKAKKKIEEIMQMEDTITKNQMVQLEKFMGVSRVSDMPTVGLVEHVTPDYNPGSTAQKPIVQTITTTCADPASLIGTVGC